MRVKRNKNLETYMEFKTPGASANPYLVMSAVLAAGMDGLRQKQLVSSSTALSWLGSFR